MRKKKGFLSILLSAILSLTITIPAMAADTVFSDVAAHTWYADAAEYVSTHGIMGGTSAETFSPDATMTRAMLATVLYRASGSPAIGAAADFSDVSRDAYYANAVSWACEAGIISGYGNGLFGANDPVTREQLAAILWRYRESPVPAGTDAGFADQSAISAYAVNATLWAQENGILSGMEGNRFAPKENATRAQVAVILYNLLQGKGMNRPLRRNRAKAVAF